MKRPQVWRKQKAKAAEELPETPEYPKKTYRLSTRGDLDAFVKFFTGFQGDQEMIETEKRYFYKCNVCDSTDHGTTKFSFEVVDCPSCGSGNITKWEALPNLSREWSYCETFGHDWKTSRLDSKTEICSVCAAERSF